MPRVPITTADASGTSGARVRRDWPLRRITVAVGATILLALAIGIPTGVVPTPLYTRMTAVLWWNYPIWAATSILGGLVMATYIRRPQDSTPRSGAGAASGGGILAAFAVGCPVCNKLIIALVGVSGALNWWAPFQPILGIASVVGLAWALWRRMKSEYACRVGDRSPSPAPTAPAVSPPVPLKQHASPTETT